MSGAVSRCARVDGAERGEGRRRPEDGVLHEVVRRGWLGLASSQALTRHLDAEVRRYLRCGQLAARGGPGVSSEREEPLRGREPQRGEARSLDGRLHALMHEHHAGVLREAEEQVRSDARRVQLQRVNGGVRGP